MQHIFSYRISLKPYPFPAITGRITVIFFFFLIFGKVTLWFVQGRRLHVKDSRAKTKVALMTLFPYYTQQNIFKWEIITPYLFKPLRVEFFCYLQLNIFLTLFKNRTEFCKSVLEQCLHRHPRHQDNTGTINSEH